MESMESTSASTRNRTPSAPEAIYGLGIIGAWVWFWRVADGFWEHAWAIVQGIFWPAYMVFDVFQKLRG